MASLLFKSQLQEYAQKASLSAPVYDTVKEGLPHIPSFKASVIVNGVKYESPDGFRNRKTAEHAAAQIALQELHRVANGGHVTVTNPVYETGLCKNLLQEYAQKMSLPVPSYKCAKEGEGHAASFTSTVEISGICYQGGPAKSKKGAEIKAARTALTAIQAQQGFQGIIANPVITHLDVFPGARSCQPEVHAGIKRDRAFEQPTTSTRRKGKKNKKNKASRKKKESIEGSIEKDKILGESSSKVAENGQETTSVQDATAINIADQQKKPKDEISMDEEVDAKQGLGIGSTENQEQLRAEAIVALVDAKPENQGVDMIVDSQGNDEQGKQEKNDNEGGDLIVDSQGNIEQGKQEKNENETGNLIIDSQGNDEQGQQEKNETHKLSVQKGGQKEQEATQEVVVDPVRYHEEIENISVEKKQMEQETTQQVVVDLQRNHEENDKFSVEKGRWNGQETTQQVVVDPVRDHEDNKEEANQEIEGTQEKNDQEGCVKRENVIQEEVFPFLKT